MGDGPHNCSANEIAYGTKIKFRPIIFQMSHEDEKIACELVTIIFHTSLISEITRDAHESEYSACSVTWWCDEHLSQVH